MPKQRLACENVQVKKPRTDCIKDNLGLVVPMTTLTFVVIGMDARSKAMTDTAARVEATGGIEPPNRGFADLRLNHLATSPPIVG